MQVMSVDPSLIANERIRPLKRAEFERLAAAGSFEDERVELLFGVVVEMAPVGPPHSESVCRLDAHLQRLLGDRARVRCQGPYAASDISEPLPDLLVFPNGNYWREHPQQALLVIEVASSSLRRDRGIKSVLYATSEVDEYWIVDLDQGTIEVHRDRVDGRWTSVQTFRRGARVAMLAFPDVAIDVSEVVPPIGS